MTSIRSKGNVKVLDVALGSDRGGHGASEVPKIALFQVYLLRHSGVELKTDGC